MTTSENEPTGTRNLSITLDLDHDLTWGELKKFVEVAYSSGIEDHESVLLRYSDQQDLVGLEAYIDSDAISGTA